MNVLFVQPPWIESKDKASSLIKLHSVTPPLGILYIAACIREHGYEPSVLDAQVLGYDVGEAVHEILKQEFELLALTATTPIATNAFKIAKAVREKRKDAIIVMGGPHVTVTPADTFHRCPQLDYLVLGEGEITFLELIETISKGGDPKNVPGLAYQKNGRAAITKQRGFIKDLDELPLPARDLVPLDRYSLAPSNYVEKPHTTMVTSRGCPFRCLYCNKAIFGRQYRYNSAEYVLDEIAHLVERYGMREIKFWDDVFTINEERTKAICRGLKERGIDIQWSCESRVDALKKELLPLMSGSGCWQIDFGLESGSQKILDNITKDTTLGQAVRTIKAVSKSGISTRGYFIFGLPGETAETAKQTLEFSKKLDLDYVTFFVCVPYPGTRLYEQAVAEGKITTTDWSKYSHIDFGQAVYLPKTISEKDLKSVTGRAYRSFYLRPEYILKRAGKIRSADDVIKNLKAAGMLLKTI